jgi:hypothetical protein
MNSNVFFFLSHGGLVSPLKSMFLNSSSSFPTAQPSRRKLQLRKRTRSSESVPLGAEEDVILEPVENAALLVSPELTTQCQGGLVGLLNLGDTCYINAVLQAFFHCAPLRAEICEMHEQMKRDRAGEECDARIISPLIATLARFFFTIDAAQYNVRLQFHTVLDDTAQ